MCSVFFQTGEGVAVTLMTNCYYKTVKVKIIYLPDLCTMHVYQHFTKISGVVFLHLLCFVVIM